MSVTINQITNANIYIDGNSLLGHAKEIKLPEIEIEMIEHKALGMVGTVELPGGVNALEGEITWDGFYPEVFAKAFNPFSNVQLMVRANVQVFNSQGLAAEEPMVCMLNVAFSKNPLGEYKPKEAAEFASTVKVYSINQKVAGKELLFYDSLANIYRVGGEDMLAKYRANIGG